MSQLELYIFTYKDITLTIIVQKRVGVKSLALFMV